MKHGTAVSTGGIAGAVASAFVTLCCIGLPAVLSLLVAIGAGFLIRDAVLLPLLLACLAVAGYGMVSARRRHGRNAPIVLFLVSAVTILVSIWVSDAAAIAGAVLLIGATVLNLLLSRRPQPTQE